MRTKSAISAKEIAFLALLVAGVVVPYAHFASWLADNGLDVPLLVRDVFATPISSFFGWDVIVTVLTLLVLMAVDRTLPNGLRLLVGAASLLGASVGLPLYLWLRERHIRLHFSAVRAADQASL